MDFEFDKEVTEYWIDKDSTLTIEKGVYTILVSIPEGEEHMKSYWFIREFKKDSAYSLRLELPRIMQKKTRTVHYPKYLGFYNCDEICDGMQQDFYANGKIRMEGEFKNGIPVKELRKYNKDGKLVEIELYRKDGTYRESKYLNYELYLKNN